MATNVSFESQLTDPDPLYFRTNEGFSNLLVADPKWRPNVTLEIKDNAILGYQKKENGQKLFENLNEV